MWNKVLRGCGLILLISISGLAAKENPQDFFKKMRAEMFNQIPSEFTANLTGVTIDNKLKAIPRSSYKAAGLKPEVVLTYDRKKALELKVANVDELYEDLFAQYVRLFTLGPILSNMADSVLFERYDFELEYTSAGLVQLRIRMKDAENSFLAYVNPADMTILRMDYFMGQKLMTSTLIKYSNKTRHGKKYNLPTTFMVKTFTPNDDGKPESFKLENILIP